MLSSVCMSHRFFFLQYNHNITTSREAGAGVEFEVGDPGEVWGCCPQSACPTDSSSCNITITLEQVCQV